MKKIPVAAFTRVVCFSISLLIFPQPINAALDYTLGTNIWLDRGIDKKVLFRAISKSSDYLVKAQLPSGQFIYINDPLGRYSPKKKGKAIYSLIRHLGAVYSLLRSYQVNGNMSYLKTAETSLDFAYRFAAETEEGFVIKGPKNRLSLGENGFFLINAVLFNHLAGVEKYSDITLPIVNFLTRSLTSEGPFSTSKKWAECQAVIGLAHYFRYVRQDPFILSVTYNWLKEHVKKGVTSHWTVQALNWFSRMDEKKGKEFTNFAVSGGKTLLKGVVTKSSGKNGRTVGARRRGYASCGVTARNEGLIAAYIISERAKDKIHARFFRSRIEEHIAQALQFQYGFEGNFFEGDTEMKRIREIFDLQGGVFNKPDEGYIRIDYVSHHIRAMAAYYLVAKEPGSVDIR